MEPIRAEQGKLVGGEIIFLMGRNGRKASALKGKRVVGVKSIKHAARVCKIQRKTRGMLAGDSGLERHKRETVAAQKKRQ